jgi:hypothetical protein
MEPLRSIEEAIRNKLHVAAGPGLHDRVLARVRQADAESKESPPAVNGPVIRSSAEVQHEMNRRQPSSCRHRLDRHLAQRGPAAMPSPNRRSHAR